MASTIKTIIFDLDGTLIDSAQGIQFAISAAVRTVLPGTICPDVATKIGPPIKQILRFALKIEDDNLISLLSDQFRQAYDSEGWKKTVLYPNARRVLNELRKLNIQLFVLTNKPGHITPLILGELQINEYFEQVFCLDSIRPKSISKVEAAANLCGTYNWSPDTVFLVGDSEDDAQAAFHNGFTFLAVSYGYGSAWKSPLRERFQVVDSLAEILLLVDKFQPTKLHAD